MAVGIERGGSVQVSYEGAVLASYERNGRDDSDFYAIVWDEGSQRVREIEYATTRGWTYNNYARIDASAEVIAKAQAWAASYLEGVYRSVAEDAARVIAKGLRVRFVEAFRGRKEQVLKGSEGEVFWAGIDGFKSSRWGTRYRIGVKLDDGRKVFVDSEKLEVANPAAVDQVEIARRAAYNAKSMGWLSIMSASMALISSGGRRVAA